MKVTFQKNISFQSISLSKITLLIFFEKKQNSPDTSSNVIFVDKSEDDVMTMTSI